MSNLQEWSDYLEQSFGLTIKFEGPESEEIQMVENSAQFSIGGFYCRGKNKIVVKNERSVEDMFKTLIHELGHHLCWVGKLSYKGNPFVREYFCKIDFKRRFAKYHKSELQEEMIVECLAHWALGEAKHRSLYGDLIGIPETTDYFREYLVSLGTSTPPEYPEFD